MSRSVVWYRPQVDPPVPLVAPPIDQAAMRLHLLADAQQTNRRVWHPYAFGTNSPVQDRMIAPSLFSAAQFEARPAFL